ncbi:hypothetical protein DFH27DRAFT_616443 [Peziza echinospora]|nr:hypothetical protein DFH27DRAFT_616443 [Peziza echinospora]
MAISEASITLIAMLFGGIVFVTVMIITMIIATRRRPRSITPSLPNAFELEHRPDEPARLSLDLTPMLPQTSPPRVIPGYTTVPLQEPAPAAGFVERFLGLKRVKNGEKRWNRPRDIAGVEEEDCERGSTRRGSRESLW